MPAFFKEKRSLGRTLENVIIKTPIVSFQAQFSSLVSYFDGKSVQPWRFPLGKFLCAEPDPILK